MGLVVIKTFFALIETHHVLLFALLFICQKKTQMFGIQGEQSGGIHFFARNQDSSLNLILSRRD